MEDHDDLMQGAFADFGITIAPAQVLNSSDELEYLDEDF